MLANLYSLASALPPPPTASLTGPGTSLQYPSQSRTRKSLMSCSFRTASAAPSFPPPIPPPPSHTFLISLLRTTPSRPPPIGNPPPPQPVIQPCSPHPQLLHPRPLTHFIASPSMQTPLHRNNRIRPLRPFLPPRHNPPPPRPSKSTLQHHQCPRSSIHPISFPPVFMPPPQLLLSPLHLSPPLFSIFSLLSSLLFSPSFTHLPYSLFNSNSSLLLSP